MIWTYAVLIPKAKTMHLKAAQTAKARVCVLVKCVPLQERVPRKNSHLHLLSQSLEVTVNQPDLLLLAKGS